MRIFSMIAALLCAVVMTPASATTLVANSSWQIDQVDGTGLPSLSAPWTFTLSGNGVFSVADCCVRGDIYTLSGSVSGVTTFYAGSATDIQNEGMFASYWTDEGYSKIAVALSAGTYSISIAGDCAAGCPSALGVRLDTVSGAVPEPATWALMLAGFGMIGLSARRRAAVATVRFA